MTLQRLTSTLGRTRRIKGCNNRRLRRTRWPMRLLRSCKSWRVRMRTNPLPVLLSLFVPFLAFCLGFCLCQFMWFLFLVFSMNFSLWLGLVLIIILWTGYLLAGLFYINMSNAHPNLEIVNYNFCGFHQQTESWLLRLFRLGMNWGLPVGILTEMIYRALSIKKLGRLNLCYQWQPFGGDFSDECHQFQNIK